MLAGIVPARDVAQGRLGMARGLAAAGAAVVHSYDRWSRGPDEQDLAEGTRCHPARIRIAGHAPAAVAAGRWRPTARKPMAVWSARAICEIAAQ